MNINTTIYPCDRGTGWPIGYHHFEASPNGIVVCRYCGTKPTAREATLGALSGADLGKRVVTEWGAGKLIEVAHTVDEPTEYMYRDEANGWVPTFASHPPDTPVTVYDEEET